MIQQEKHGFKSHIDGFYDIERQLPDYLLRKAEGYFEAEDERERAITGVEDFEARRNNLRHTFMNAIGGLPKEQTPLNAVVTGTVTFEHMQIRKVLFESLPKMYVTANLYVPNGITKPTPAVLLACGHAKEGKACETYQQVALDLANNGLIVLVVDPIGQGERLQYDRYEPDGTYSVGRITREHTYIGQQCVLTGSNLARYMIWDLMRAIDYLESLDIVDSSRIGMTGNSGGGTQTAYMMLCEKRLAAAMPCCYISTRLDYMKTGQVQDLEQIVYGVIEKGIGHDDLITGMAPKPVRIGAARYDFFCSEGAEKTCRKAENVYRLYMDGKETDIKDLVSVVYAEQTHSYSAPLRQGAVNFFRRVLLGMGESFVADPCRPVLPEEMLWVTKVGNIREEFNDLKTPWQYNLDRLEQIHFTDTTDKKLLGERVKNVLRIPAAVTNRTEIRFPRIISDETELWCEDSAAKKTGPREQSIRIRKFFFFTEEDILCTGVLLEHTDVPNTHCTIYVSDNSTEEMEKYKKDIQTLLKDGAVFVFDPRGTGASKARKVYPTIATTHMGITFNNYYKLNCDAQMMGTSLYAFRVYDILRAYDLMTGYLDFVEVDLAGRNYGAVDILTAAVLLEDTQTTVFGSTISFEEIVRTEYYHIDPRNNIHGLLQAYDVPLLKRVLGTTEILD